MQHQEGSFPLLVLDMGEPGFFNVINHKDAFQRELQC